jgi:3-oxoadipate enol-lactonase
MPELTLTRLTGSAQAPHLLLVGPSLGTSVETIWARCARLLGDTFEVVGWDLPGHGRSRPAEGPFSIADLADAVRKSAEPLAGTRSAWYAGVSLAGAVGLQLALDPGPFRAVAALASAPRIGDARSWADRAALVRRAGTPVMVESSAVRWFAPGFIDRQPTVAGTLLRELTEVDTESYAAACDALAEFDLRADLVHARVPVLMVAGGQDQTLGQERVQAGAASASGATFEVVKRCGHLPPVEDPSAVASMLRSYFTAKEVAPR